MDTAQMLLSLVLYLFDSVFFSSVYATESLDLDPLLLGGRPYRYPLKNVTGALSV